MAEIRTSDPEKGQIQIADEVIAIIAGTAALEIEGVVPSQAGGNFTGDIAEMLGKKNLAKGVKVSVEDDTVSVTIDILVKYGYKIPDVSLEVQKRVKTAIETMTGLGVASVDVNTLGIHADKR